MIVVKIPPQKILLTNDSCDSSECIGSKDSFHSGVPSGSSDCWYCSYECLSRDINASCVISVVVAVAILDRVTPIGNRSFRDPDA